MSNPWRRWALGAAGALVGVLLLGWVVLQWGLPAWLEQRVVAALKERGVESAALRVHAPGLRGIRITEVRLGAAPDLRIGEIALRWSAASLWRGRAEELAIRDVEWRVALRDGRVDFGALTPLLTPKASSESAPAAGPLVLPLERASLEALRIRLAAPSGPIEGRAALALAFGAEGVESGRVTLEASDAAGALELHGQAALEPLARVTGELTGRLASGSGLPALESGAFTLRFSGFAPVAGRILRPAPDAIEGLDINATLDANAAGAGASGALALTLELYEKRALLQAELRSARGEGFELPVAGLSANVIDWTSRVPVVDALVISLPEGRVGEIRVRDLQVDLTEVAPGADEVRGYLSLRGEVKAPRAPAASLELQANFEATADALGITGQECADVGLAAGALGAGGWRLARPLALCVEGSEATLRAAADGSVHIEGALALVPTELRLQHRDGRRIVMTTPRLEVRGSRDADGDSLHARSAGGSLDLADLQLALRGLAAEVDLTRTDSAGAKAQLTLALDELRDLAPKPRAAPLALAGTASLEDDQLRFTATARDTSGAFRLEAKGLHTLGSGRGHAALELPTLQFRKQGLQPQALVPLLEPFVSRARGGLGARAQLAWGANGLAPVRLEVALDELSVDTPWLRLRRLVAALRLEDAIALSSAPKQRITAGRIDPGLPLENAALSFTLDAGKLDVDAFDAAVAGGRLSATGRFDPAAKAGSLTLNLRELDLVQLLEGERVAGLAATGRLSGSITAALEAGMPQDLAGRLESDAAGGVIRYRPATPPASLMAAGTGGALALEALRDFHYQRVAVVLGGDARRAELRIELSGSNPAVENGRPIEFQLNFTSAFGELLRAWRLEQRFEERLGQPPQATPQS